nr:homeobox protein cut-like 1 [Camelus dromedarius]
MSHLIFATWPRWKAQGHPFSRAVCVLPLDRKGRSSVHWGLLPPASRTQKAAWCGTTRHHHTPPLVQPYGFPLRRFPLLSLAGPRPSGQRRKRLVLKLSQKDALQALFQQNPYPGIKARESLARDLGIPESRIQVWFQNQRRRSLRQSRPPSGNILPEGNRILCTSLSAHTMSIMALFGGGSCMARKPFNPLVLKTSKMAAPKRPGRRSARSFSPSQTGMLVQAFERERFPGIATREEGGSSNRTSEPRIHSVLKGLLSQVNRQEALSTASASEGQQFLVGSGVQACLKHPNLDHQGEEAGPHPSVHSNMKSL